MSEQPPLASDQARPLYSRFAWAYDRIVPEPSGGTVVHVARTLRSMGVPTGSLVIDAGCGSGRYTRGLAALGYQVVGLDRSPALIDHARRRPTDATFVLGDLLSWQPAEPPASVLCRGVLNDLTHDTERGRAFESFATWLRLGGLLLADVRDWDATVARYSRQSRQERSFRHARAVMSLLSETTLDADAHLMRVCERYVGKVDGLEVDERDSFVMRCWTQQEVESHARQAGFKKVEIRLGKDTGIAPDRLSIVAWK